MNKIYSLGGRHTHSAQEEKSQAVRHAPGLKG